MDKFSIDNLTKASPKWLLDKIIEWLITSEFVQGVEPTISESNLKVYTIPAEKLTIGIYHNNIGFQKEIKAHKGIKKLINKNKDHKIDINNHTYNLTFIDSVSKDKPCGFISLKEQIINNDSSSTKIKESSQRLPRFPLRMDGCLPSTSGLLEIIRDLEERTQKECIYCKRKFETIDALDKHKNIHINEIKEFEEFKKIKEIKTSDKSLVNSKIPSKLVDSITTEMFQMKVG